MALVKAKVDVYLGENGGYHKADEVFDYVGPKNHNLEPTKEAPTPEESK